MTQSVAAVATEIKHLLGEISDNSSSGMHLHDIGVHTSIIPASIIGLALSRPENNHPARAKLQPQLFRNVGAWVPDG